jgi:hypothetical protein
MKAHRQRRSIPRAPPKAARCAALPDALAVEMEAPRGPGVQRFRAAVRGSRSIPTARRRGHVDFTQFVAEVASVYTHHRRRLAGGQNRSMIVFRCFWRVLRGVLLTLARSFCSSRSAGAADRTRCATARWPPLAFRGTHRERAVALRAGAVPSCLPCCCSRSAARPVADPRGRAVLGIGVIIVAKVLGTALVGRLFVLTEPS